MGEKGGWVFFSNHFIFFPLHFFPFSRREVAPRIHIKALGERCWLSSAEENNICSYQTCPLHLPLDPQLASMGGALKKGKFD